MTNRRTDVILRLIFLATLCAIALTAADAQAREVLFSWNQVTELTDGSPALDMGGYDLSCIVDGGAFESPAWGASVADASCNTTTGRCEYAANHVISVGEYMCAVRAFLTEAGGGLVSGWSVPVALLIEASPPLTPTGLTVELTTGSKDVER